MQEIKQTDRHHQENLRPFCVIDFSDASEQHPFGIEFDPDSRRRRALMAGEEQITQPPELRLHGNLRNKGNGPATDVVTYLNTRRGEGEDVALRLTRPVVVSGLVGVGETITIDLTISERDVIRVRVGAVWRPVQVFHAVAGEAYEAVVDYRDAFGNVFRTAHPKGIWANSIPNLEEQATREQAMLRQDRPTPIFLTGRQAVRTQADLPHPQSILPDEPSGSI